MFVLCIAVILVFSFHCVDDSIFVAVWQPAGNSHVSGLDSSGHVESPGVRRPFPTHRSVRKHAFLGGSQGLAKSFKSVVALLPHFRQCMKPRRLTRWCVKCSWVSLLFSVRYPHHPHRFNSTRRRFQDVYSYGVPYHGSLYCVAVCL